MIAFAATILSARVEASTPKGLVRPGRLDCGKLWPLVTATCRRLTGLSLAPGTRLGPYEIVAPPGAGGMGEVYRARAPRLGREVALKVLPEAVAFITTGSPASSARRRRSPLSTIRTS